MTEIIANDVQFLEPREQAVAAGNQPGRACPQRRGSHDDIPAPTTRPATSIRTRSLSRSH